jgi:hypothetical protein
MASLATKDLKQALTQKGFRQDDTDHSMFWLIVDGRKRAVRTRISHGLREYSDALLSRVAHQMKLSRRELAEFIRCPMDHNRYVAVLVERGALGNPSDRSPGEP